MTIVKGKIIKLLDIVVISMSIIICVIAFIIDGYNACVNNGINIDYSFVSATFLLAIATHFILSGFIQDDILSKQKHLETKLSEAVDSIITSVNGIDVKFFDDINTVDMYIAKKIRSANFCVYDFNWQDYIETNPYHRGLSEKEYASNEIDKSIKFFCSKVQTPSRMYKEIFTFSYPKNLAKMNHHISYGDAYNCSYYENKNAKSKFPKLQYVVIDDEEVIFVSSAYIPNLCSIKNKRIANIFCNYFEQAWELSIKIKVANNIQEDTIRKIRMRYEQITNNIE